MISPREQDPVKMIRNVLVSPLEWGLGHTVRLVPLIEYLQKQGHRVLVAADGASYLFYQGRFPGITLIRMPFTPVQYATDRRFFRTLLPQIPRMMRAIRHNHRALSQLVRDEKIDLIISDNRYGMTCQGVPSVFISTQLWLKAPPVLAFGEPLTYLMHRWAIRKFTHLWIADFFDPPGITGILGHAPLLPRKTQWIGPVSRLNGSPSEPRADMKRFRIVAIVSGPEPQRSLFEEELRLTLTARIGEALIIRGLPSGAPPGHLPDEQIENLHFMNHASDEALAWYMRQAELVICRPGISSLSDLVALQANALLVPTPGQTEQEYLARHLLRHGYFAVAEQGTLSTDRMEAAIQHPFKKFSQPIDRIWQEALERLLRG